MLYALFLLLNFFAFSAATCPNGSPPFKDRCLYFETTKSAFFVADSVCNGYGGHLVSIHALDENMVISQLAGAKFTESSESDFWFGATDVYSPSKWSWLDNSSFDFTNWGKNQPVDTDGSDCGAVILHGGKWKADDCYNEKPYVCAVAASNEITNTTTTKTATTTTTRPKKCPTSWTYYDTTGYCYVVLQNETWVNAEGRCKVENAHLASIHNITEALFVKDMAFPDNTVPHVWIGLFTDDKNVHWSWTDGTPFDYPNWSPGQPDNPGVENCGVIWNNEKFNNLDCNFMTKFVCKMLPL